MVQPPYITCPPGVSADEVLAHFPRSLKVRLVLPDEEDFFEALGPTPSEALELGRWIVNVGPDLLWQLTAWGLATYAGKKLVETIAAEAGKDLYTAGKNISGKSARGFFKGLRSLAEFARTKTSKNAALAYAEEDGPTFHVVAGSYRAGVIYRGGRRLYYDVGFEFPIAGIRSEAEALDDFERIFVPLLGILPLKVDELRVTVFPLDAARLVWGLSIGRSLLVEVVPGARAVGEGQPLFWIHVATKCFAHADQPTEITELVSVFLIGLGLKRVEWKEWPEA